MDRTEIWSEENWSEISDSYGISRYINARNALIKYRMRIISLLDNGQRGERNYEGGLKSLPFCAIFLFETRETA